jgi:hypothetical protein
MRAASAESRQKKWQSRTPKHSRTRRSRNAVRKVSSPARRVLLPSEQTFPVRPRHPALLRFAAAHPDLIAAVVSAGTPPFNRRASGLLFRRSVQ